MAKSLVSMLFILLFTTVQSYAAVCASACFIKADTLKTSLAKGKSKASHCHAKKDSSDSQESSSEQKCEMADCLEAPAPAKVVVEQINKKDAIAKLLTSGQSVVLEAPSRDSIQVATHNISISPKYRLHLLIQVFRN